MKLNEAEKEYQDTRFLSEIDPQFQFFLYPTSFCKTIADRTNDEKAENPLNKCRTTLKNNDLAKEKGEWAFLQIPDGGTSWTSLKGSDFPKFFRSCLNIIKGLDLLHNNYYAHMDIKPSNISIVTAPDGSLHSRLIDFGLSFHTKSAIEPTLQNTFTANYEMWPYETRFLHPMFPKDAVTLQSITDYFYKKVLHFKYISPIAGLAVENNFYEKLWNKLRGNKQNPFTAQTFLGLATDIFSLGESICYVYSTHTHHRLIGTSITLVNNIDFTEEEIEFHNLLSMVVSIPFYKLILKMTNPNPFNRAYLDYVLMELHRITDVFEKLYVENKAVADAIFAK